VNLKKKSGISSHSQLLSITLCRMATGNNVEDLKLIRFISQSTGITVLEPFTAEQTRR